MVNGKPEREVIGYVALWYSCVSVVCYSGQYGDLLPSHLDVVEPDDEDGCGRHLPLLRVRLQPSDGAHSHQQPVRKEVRHREAKGYLVIRVML